MKYLETKHERNSAKITSLITIILLLLLFVVGLPFMDPPLEYGVAVNFGNSNVGSGNKPKALPVKAPTKKVVEPVKPQPPQPEKKVEESSKAEDVITDETAESIAIKKQKEAEAKAKAEAERLERERQEAEEQRLREEAEKAKKIDQINKMIGGVKNSKSAENGGEGPDSSSGNKGQLDGNYAPSYFGGAGPGKGGVGYGLNGRGRPTRDIYKQDCNEYGVVVVQIKVNRSGQVISAVPGAKGTTNTHPCLYEPAKKIALSHKWPADSNAPAEQVGFVSINFDVTQ